MDKAEFIKRRKEDAVVFEGTLRDMMELSSSNKLELRSVLRYFKSVIE